MGLLRSQRSQVVAVAACAALIASGVTAFAAIPNSSTGVIDACYNKQGALRVIDAEANETCRPPEKPLQWNQQGPKGDPGPQGIQGPQGEAGPSEAYGVFRDENVHIGSTEPVTVATLRNLPPGHYAISAKTQRFKLEGTEFTFATCRLSAGPNFDISPSGMHPGRVSQSVAVQILHGQDSPFDAKFECWKRVASEPDFDVNVTKITAIRLGRIVRNDAVTN